MHIDSHIAVKNIIYYKTNNPSGLLTERKEEFCLFYDTLYTLYLLLYGIEHMIKGQLSEKGNPLPPPHGLLFSVSSKGSFIYTFTQTE